MTSRFVRRTVAVLTVVSLVAAATACGSSNKTRKRDTTPGGPSVVTKRQGEYLVHVFDLDGDGAPDVLKFIEQYQSEQNPDVTKRRIHKKKVDVNGDGSFDIIKRYDETGATKRETADTDLDGTMDIVRDYQNGALAQKKVLADDGESVVSTRFYSNGKLTRVEKDTNGDGKVDHWEYYRDGNLERIGRDADADQKIDKWVYAD